MIISSTVPPHLPAGRLAAREQPVLALGAGGELRPWAAQDAPALVAAGQDPGISRWNLLPEHSLDAALARIERMHQRWSQEQAAVWAIAHHGTAVGLIGCTDLDLAHGSAELVYWLLPAARGAGLAPRAVTRLSRWALDDLGLHRLTLCHSTANPASCRVAEKTGFTLEGTMRQALQHADGWHDQHLHSLLRGDRATPDPPPSGSGGPASRSPRRPAAPHQ